MPDVISVNSLTLAYHASDQWEGTLAHKRVFKRLLEQNKAKLSESWIFIFPGFS